MKKNQTVTIGIPAYNEEANIGSLLDQLLSQKQQGYVLHKILIASDGSTDRTVKIVSGFANSKVKLIDGKKREGASYRQNQIISLSNSDILVLLDGDILPKGRNFISEIIKPIAESENVGLVSAKIVPANPRNVFENIVNYSTELKSLMEIELLTNNRNKIYLCHGTARAFSKRFYKKLVFPQIPGEDAYSYLECIKKGFSFVYQELAVVSYRSPSNFKDHFLQSTRFYQTRRRLKLYFDPKLVNQEFNIAKTVLIKTALKGFVRNPIKAISYTFILAFAKFLFYSNILKTSYIWTPSISSKKI